MHSPIPLTRDVVLVGGGHAHALVLRKWGMKPVPGARLTLIDPGASAPYTGMLPGHVAGHYPREALEIDLVRLARFAGARLVRARALGIDHEARRIEVEGRPNVSYDVASIDIGITTDMPALPGFVEHAVGAKPLGAFASRWEAFLGSEEGGGDDASEAGVAVIGAGVAGCELAMAMAHRLEAAGRPSSVTLIEAGAEPLRDTSTGARRIVLDRLDEMGITIETSAKVTEITADGVILADGRTLPAGFVTGAAGARPQGWLAETDLALENGFVRVDTHLRSSDPAIYAVGDCAHLTDAPRPKAGVFAVREAPILYRNLVAEVTGGARRAFHPQRDYLKLISLGEKSAVADRAQLAFSGPWLWRQKDRIDQTFMRRFRDLPRMAAPAIPSHAALGVREDMSGAPQCGGCGSKVAPADLADALATLPVPTRADVMRGAGDDAAILAHGSTAQVVTSDHFRAFTLDWAMLARIVTVHALGDVWAMGAAPQAGLLQVTLPRMTSPLAAASMREILAEAGDVLRGAGADLVGGHSAMGAEMTIGVTVTGLAERVIEQSGARTGDALVLTKPLGSGVLMAGEMRDEARGRDVAEALDIMARGQAAEAGILAPHACAMTDVTGFGLAGHLAQMMQASGGAARLDLAAIPLMAGAEALASRGIRSSLFDANAAALGARFMAEAGPRRDLALDPQTAGGLLAAVPRDTAHDIVTQLHSAGANAALIGEVVAGPAGTVDARP